MKINDLQCSSEQNHNNYQQLSNEWGKSEANRIPANKEIKLNCLLAKWLNDIAGTYSKCVNATATIAFMCQNGLEMCVACVWLLNENESGTECEWEINWRRNEKYKRKEKYGEN